LLLLAPFLLLACACSRQKTITAEDLCLELTSAISLAADAETSVDLLRQGRSTDRYADGHLAYLSEELNHSLKELEEASPDAAIASTAQNARTLLGSLALQVAAVRSDLGDSGALSNARQQIAKTRADLEAAKSSL
jgi:hypothetical protein